MSYEKGRIYPFENTSVIFFFKKTSPVYKSCHMESRQVVHCIGRKRCQQNSTVFINQATESSHPHWQRFSFKSDTSCRTLNRFTKEQFSHHVLESHLQNHCLLLRRMHVRMTKLVSQRSSELCRYMLRVSSWVTAARQGTFFSLQDITVMLEHVTPNTSLLKIIQSVQFFFIKIKTDSPKIHSFEIVPHSSCQSLTLYSTRSYMTVLNQITRSMSPLCYSSCCFQF